MAGLTDRVALITGASRGIGAATALMFAEQGADVAINYHSNRERAEAVASQVRALGRRAEVYQADVTNFEDCKQMCDAALADFGRVDILVNNAGIGYNTYGTPLVTEADLHDFRKFFDFHVLACMHMCQLLVPQMRTRPRGDVIMVSSYAAQLARPRWAGYTVSKAGMEALAQVLAKEEREFGIRVNVVAPGPVDTEMIDGILSKTGQSKEKFAEQQPFGFMCQPEDVAAAILYLCSEGGRYVTGQRVTVNGGG